MARQNKSSRIDLHDALSRRTYHNAVLCTYTFEARFFEDYCLEKFSALSANNNVSVCTDRGTYQKIAFAPESQRPKHVNLRYLLSPIDTKGRFHPKLYLFTTKNSGRLILGSFNFTRPGLTSNAELADVFDFEAEEQEGNLPLFQDAFAFIEALAEGSPVRSFGSNVRELRRTTPWLGQTPAPGSTSVRLFHNLEHSLWKQIAGIVPRPVERVHVVSRFFDEAPTLVDRVTQEFDPASAGSRPATRLSRSSAELATIIIDTREQEGYSFDPRLAATVRRALPAGDYSVAGLESTVVVERKSLDGFVSTVIHGRARFHKELRKLAQYRAACVVVEAGLLEVLLHRYRGDAHPNAVLGSALSITLDFRVPVFFCSSRQAACQFVQAYLLAAHTRWHA